MGLDHSVPSGGAKKVQFGRGKSLSECNSKSKDDHLQSVSDGSGISPEQSTCSDVDLPYISYTVNRPIGESPGEKQKLTRAKSLTRQSSLSLIRRRSKSQECATKNSDHKIVIVKKGKKQPDKYEDANLWKLQEIPTFLPIIQSTVNRPSQRELEILDKLDVTPLSNFCHLYQGYLSRSTNDVYERQKNITMQIAEIDTQVSDVAAEFLEEQKTFATCVECFCSIKEIMENIDKLVAQLNNCIHMASFINSALPDEDRLESVVWNDIS